MKQFLVAALAVAVSGAPGLTGKAQPAENAAAIAEKQYAEERYKRLNTAVEDLLAAQNTLQKRLSALAEEVQAIHQEQARAPNRFATREDLKKLADSLHEIEKRREEDRRVILEEIRRLAAAPLPEPPPKKTVSTEPAPGEPGKGYEYVVKESDTLSDIVQAYRKNGVKVTLDQVLKANPKLNPKRLQVGQKVFIPAPAE
jgi:nucleoid-associated protein YgaU